MSAPIKPWEDGRLNSSCNPPTISAMPGPSGISRSSRSLNPLLPPRPMVTGPQGVSNSYNHQSYRSYNYGHSPYSSGYGGYGGYGSYGGYGGGIYGGYSGYGPETRFIQLAEESTRPAFEGVESVVRAFNSFAMMLDSTYFAMSNSFRAVLGVAENFGRIRSMFGQLWSSFALLRFINWLYKKVLSALGYKATEDLGRAAWKEALRECAGKEPSKPSSWPIFTFLGVIIAAPYLINKLLPTVVDKCDPKHWKSVGKEVRAIHRFQASSSQELALQPGDKVTIAPLPIQQEMNLHNTGWAFATSKRGTGLIPLNYIQSFRSEYQNSNVSASVNMENEFKRSETLPSHNEPEIRDEGSTN